ncbi:CHAT domain-containing protein [Mycena leptocephala]|nr:CHAT domain-containing protein [Mycena leptocephala]
MERIAVPATKRMAASPATTIEASLATMIDDLRNPNNANGWVHILGDTGFWIPGLDAYVGKEDLRVEIRERLGKLRPTVTCQAFFSLLQALVAQAQHGQLLDQAQVKSVRYYGSRLLLYCGPNDPRRAEALSLAVVAGIFTHWREGKDEDLTEVIRNLGELLKREDHKGDDRFHTLCLQAGTLFKRFQRQRNLADLHKTCQCLTEAETLSPDDISRARVNTKRGLALSTRFDVLGDMATSQAGDLELSLELQEEANAMEPTMELPRHLSLTHYGRALVLKSQQPLAKEEVHTDRRPLLDSAIEKHREALGLCPHMSLQPGSTQFDERRFGCLSALVFALRVRIEKFPTTSDQVLEAIQYGEEAKTLLPNEHPALVGLYRDLAILHFHVPNLEACFRQFEAAVGVATAAPKERLSVAVRWASCAHKNRHHSTGDAYSEAMKLLNRCFTAYTTVDTQHEFLARPLTRTECSALTSNAAAFAIEEERLDEAVEIIEQGRTFIWTLMGNYRHPLDQLKDADAKRGEEFERLSNKIERFTVTFDIDSLSVPFESSSATADQREYKTRWDLANEWEKKLDDIRSSLGGGFRFFLEPPPFCELQNAAEEGPVIILNQSSFRLDALILFMDEDPKCVPLTGDLGSIAERVAHLGHLAPESNPPDVTAVVPTNYVAIHGEPRTHKETLAILDLLWDIIHPVVAELRRSLPKMSRIWWYPTSLLGVLPFHAAGRYSNEKDTQNNLPDLYISSYTTTLSTLINARNSLKNSHPLPPSILIVGHPGRLGRFLYEVDREIKIVQSLWPQHRVARDTAATCQAAIDGLKTHQWIHFASHGYHSETNPLDSGFELEDGLLKLREFMLARADGRLAVLGACHASAGASTTPDEVLHLAAAIQFTGFNSVVGTLWTMADVSGPSFAENFYPVLLHNGLENIDVKDSALALNKATRAMRSKAPAQQWVTFLHIGV